MRKESGKMRRRSFGTAMGITSIIAILVILVLVVFSALSLITAKADLNLSQKTADNIESYYAADTTGEMITASFGDIIKAGKADSIKPGKLQNRSEEFTKGNNYSYDAADHIFRFTVPIDDSRDLKAEVRYNENGKISDILLWQVVPSKEWEKDDSIQLFQP